jgi:Flp pilus assembly pilin Flp
MRRFTFEIRTFVATAVVSTRVAGLRREEGQTFIEYAVVLGVVVVAMAGALTFLHDQVSGMYTQISGEFAAAMP